MRFLDDHVVLTPEDLAQCEYSLLRRLSESRGLVEPVHHSEFLAERSRTLAQAQVGDVVREYQRKYPRQFTQLDQLADDAMTSLHQRHEETVNELRSLRAVAGGILLTHLTPRVTLAANPVVAMLGSVAGSVLERFAKVEHLAALGAQAHALTHASGQETVSAFLHLNNGRRTEHNGTELAVIAEHRLTHVAGLIESALERTDVWPWDAPTVRTCGFCPWCRQAQDEHRDVHLVWGVRGPSRNALKAAGVHTIEELATQEVPPETIDRFSWATFQERARLQLDEERTGEHSFLVHNPGAITALPAPDPGDIFFDFEGDPLWVEKNRYEWGLEFLFGYIEADTGEYTALWSTSQKEESAAFTRFVDHLLERLQTHPGMHVYHFAFYEPRTMRRLARRHRTRQKEVAHLLDSGVFVDLYETVKASVHTSRRSYGLKALEPLYMGDELRSSDVGDGAQAVSAFQSAIRARRSGDREEWDRVARELADYNRYDCLSTWRLRDWLLEHGSADAIPSALESLGATPLTAEPLITPLAEPRRAALPTPGHSVPGFDEAGIFYISSGSSTDALGVTHKTHEFLGLWGSTTRLQPDQHVRIVYSDPATGATDTSSLLTREARIVECDAVGGMHRLTLIESTQAHDPASQGLSPVYAHVMSDVADPSTLLKRAKRIRYTLVTGPASSAIQNVANEEAQETGAAVIDSAHITSVAQALDSLQDAEHVIVAGDPALATPVPPRALPGDVVNGPLLSWLLGESGAKVEARHEVETTDRFFPELGHAVEKFVYDGAHVVTPPGNQVRLLPQELTGLQSVPVDHRGNRASSPEEVEAVQDLLTRLFSAGPLAEDDVLVTAAFDTQVLLLRRGLERWPGVRVEQIDDVSAREAAVSVISLGFSTLADLPPNTAPLATHVLGRALTRAREAAFIVHSAHVLTQLPARSHAIPDVTRFADLIR